jgi:K+-sensing histidine kinase KdpD
MRNAYNILVGKPERKSINRIVFMDFIHRLVSQDQKTKIVDKKTKNLNGSNNKGQNYKPQSNKPGHTHT